MYNKLNVDMIYTYRTVSLQANYFVLVFKRQLELSASYAEMVNLWPIVTSLR